MKKTYDFDRVIDRRGSGSIKYDFSAEQGRIPGTLPLWVADMDFQSPPEVLEALRQTADHGVFGYTEVKDDYYQAVAGWFERRFAYRTRPEWLVKTPGVVCALALAVRAFSDPGQAVLIQEPVYHPFARIVLDNGRRLVSSDLVYEEGQYRIDFDDFEKKIAENKAKLFILCSPHNPVGRVWTEKELRRIGEICLKHGCLVVSDEIHADFVRPGFRHRIFASLGPEFEAASVICTAPSKTFNLAGLQTSHIFIADPGLRRIFSREQRKAGGGQINVMGLTAARAAYQYGADWLDQLLIYLEENLSLVREFCRRRPRVKLVEPEGTYLVWLDFQALGLPPKDLDDLLLNRARIWLDEGLKFGASGAGFQRLNMACPRSTLREALTRLEKVV